MRMSENAENDAGYSQSVHKSVRYRLRGSAFLRRSIDDSKAKLKLIADSTGYDFGNLVSILTTSFIKRKNEDYQYILTMLKLIIER